MEEETNFNVDVFPSRSHVGAGVDAVFRCFVTTSSSRARRRVKEQVEENKKQASKNKSDKFSSIPSSTIVWTRKGANSTSLQPSASVDVNGTLAISGVTLDDAGKYVCSYRRGSRLRSSTAELEVTPPTPPTCAPTEFRCAASGDCIPASRRCDWKSDCVDESDEDDCEAATRGIAGLNADCQPNQLRCPKSGNCIKNYWRCDGDADCEDGWDEWRCAEKEALDAAVDGVVNDDAEASGKKGKKRYLSSSSSSSSSPNACGPTEWPCVAGGCIPNSFVGDGNFDCADKSDERGVEKPIFKTTPPSKIVACPGDRVEIVCVAVGFPLPVVSWRHNWGHTCATRDPERCSATSVSVSFKSLAPELGGSDVKTNGVVAKASPSTPTVARGRLVINNVLAEDAGLYTCEAQNRKGIAFATPNAFLQLSYLGCGREHT